MSREIRRRLKRKGLRPKAIMLYGHLHGHCFFAPTCWPSQHLLAQRMGVSQALVNGLCQELREAGVLSWKHEHKRGSKHPCNVYTLRYWTHPKIAGTLRVLRRLERANSGCPDRKGQHSRALTPSRARKRLEWRCARDDTLLVAGSSENQKRWSHDQKLWSRGARVNRCPDCGFRLQEGRVCENCHRFAEENGHLSEENERLLGMNTSLQNELVGAIETQKAQGHELARLRRELNIETEASPNAQRVRLILDAWANWHPKANTDIHGARARIVRAALRLGHTRPPLPCPVHDSNGNGKPKAAECTVVDELLEALEGARLLPFVRYGKRIAAAVPGCARKDDIADILKDEATIEEMRGYARRARMSPPERLWAAYEATRDVSEGWFRRAVESLSRNGDAR